MATLLSLIALFLLAASISVHELGHAFSMRKYGVPIQEISLLGFGKTLVSFKWKKMFGETPLYVKLFPFGAYVDPGKIGEEHTERLSIHEKCDIFSAGVFANFLFAAILCAWVVISQNLFLADREQHLSWLGLGLVPITYALYRFRKYTYPIQIVFGIIVLGVLLFFLVTHFMDFVTKNGSILSIGSDVVKSSNAIAGKSEGIPLLVTVNKAILQGATFSVSLAMMNMLPLSILDGGRIWKEWMKVVAKKFSIPSSVVLVLKVLGSSLLAFLVITALWGDLYLILKSLRHIFF